MGADRDASITRFLRAIDGVRVHLTDGGGRSQRKRLRRLRFPFGVLEWPGEAGRTEPRQWSTLNVVLLLVLLVLFLVSLPGFGIETRSFTQYASWAGPVFLCLTILVFAFGIAGILMARRRVRTSGMLTIGAAVVAIATTLLDFSHVGGPPAPTGPFVLGIVVIIVSAALLVTGTTVTRSEAVTAPPRSN